MRCTSGKDCSRVNESLDITRAPSARLTRRVVGRLKFRSQAHVSFAFCGKATLKLVVVSLERLVSGLFCWKRHNVYVVRHGERDTHATHPVSLSLSYSACLPQAQTHRVVTAVQGRVHVVLGVGGVPTRLPFSRF